MTLPSQVMERLQENIQPQRVPKTPQFSSELHEFSFIGIIVHFSYCDALGKQSLIDQHFLLPSVVLIVKSMNIFMKNNFPNYICSC